jgi:hypothetical protein
MDIYLFAAPTVIEVKKVTIFWTCKENARIWITAKNDSMETRGNTNNWKTQEKKGLIAVERNANCEVKNQKHVHREVIFWPTHTAAEMDLNNVT